MLVFLSWSGKKSKAVAEALKQWLVQVIQAVEPWISCDIAKGSRWNSEVATKLEASKFAIICLTRENLDARWILFEAGAISKLNDASVCTLLLDITPAEVEQPLSQFQHTTIEKGDFRKLLYTVNEAVIREGERGLPIQTLDGIFETFWPQLQETLVDISESQFPEGREPRTDRAILEEIVELLRNQERRQSGKAEEVHLRTSGNTQAYPGRDVIKAWLAMSLHSFEPALFGGKLRFRGFDLKKKKYVFDKSIAIRNREGIWVVNRRNAQIVIVDSAGKILEEIRVNYGDRIMLPDGSDVKVNQKLVERDPLSTPIISEVGGKVAFGDLIENVSFIEEVDTFTGQKFKVIIDWPSTLRPRIALKDKKGRTVKMPGTNYPARYLLPAGTIILVAKGDDLVAGDVLGRIPIEITAA